MGIPKSHHVNLHDPLVGLGLPLPVSEVSPERGFKVLSRPASHKTSPVIQQRTMDDVSPLTMSATAGQFPEGETPSSSRTNSGASTPQRFLTPVGGVSNLSSMRPLTGRGRERHSESSTPTTAAAAEQLSGTTGTESKLNTDSPALVKKHSFRDLLIGNLGHHTHHTTHAAHQPQTTDDVPLRTTGVPVVRRSLDYTSAGTRGVPSRPALGRVVRAQSELRYSGAGRNVDVDEGVERDGRDVTDQV